MDAGVPPRLFTAQFALVLIATAIFGISFSAYFLLPKFLALELAADAATIGSVSAVTLLASVFFMPIIGVLVDRHGRKPFACFGAFVFAMACAGFVFIDSVGPLLWLLRIFQGFGFTLFYVSLSTLATDISPPERLGQAIGLFGATMISTNALGPALAEWGAHRFGWSAVFGCTVGSATLAAALAMMIPEAVRQRAHGTPTGMFQVIMRPGLRRVLIVCVMVGWAFAAAFTFYQPWALQLGYEQVSGFLIAFAVCAMVVRVGLGSLADRLGRLRVAQFSLLLYVATPLSLIWLDRLGLLFIGGLLGLAHGIFFPAFNAVALDLAHASERGKAMAAFHGAFNLGFSAGCYLLGYVALATDYPTIFSLSGATCFAAFVILVSRFRFRNLPCTDTGS